MVSSSSFGCDGGAVYGVWVVGAFTRFKFLNGNNVLDAEKKDCVAAMRASGQSAIVVFHRDPEGFAQWADSEGNTYLVC